MCKKSAHGEKAHFTRVSLNKEHRIDRLKCEA